MKTRRQANDEEIQKEARLKVKIRNEKVQVEGKSSCLHTFIVGCFSEDRTIADALTIRSEERLETKVCERLDKRLLSIREHIRDKVMHFAPRLQSIYLQEDQNNKRHMSQSRSRFAMNSFPDYCIFIRFILKIEKSPFERRQPKTRTDLSLELPRRTVRWHSNCC